MLLDKLAEELSGVYDFTNVVDCQSVISMLLRDLEHQRLKNENLGNDLTSLAKMVRDGKVQAKVKVDNILRGVRPKTNVMAFLGRMAENMTKAEKMTDDELYEAGMEIWSDFEMDSSESCVLDELLRRFQKDENGQRTKGIVGAACQKRD